MSPKLPNVTLNCKTCGEEFITTAYKARNGAKYCSKPCSFVPMRKGATINCLHCGKVVQVRPSTAKFAKYCNHSCKGAAMRKVNANEELHQNKFVEDENDRSWAKPLPLFGVPK